MLRPVQPSDPAVGIRHHGGFPVVGLLSERVHAVSLSDLQGCVMTALTVTAKGQITLRRELLQHRGIARGCPAQRTKPQGSLVGHRPEVSNKKATQSAPDGLFTLFNQ